jgi:hypothetical protein
MRAYGSPSDIPLPFVTAALAFIVSLYYPKTISAPIAAICGFIFGVGVLYLIGLSEAKHAIAKLNSFYCPKCGTELFVSRHANDHEHAFRLKRAPALKPPQRIEPRSADSARRNRHE